MKLEAIDWVNTDGFGPIVRRWRATWQGQSYEFPTLAGAIAGVYEVGATRPF